MLPKTGLSECTNGKIGLIGGFLAGLLAGFGLRRRKEEDVVQETSE